MRNNRFAQLPGVYLTGVYLTFTADVYCFLSAQFVFSVETHFSKYYSEYPKTRKVAVPPLSIVHQGSSAKPLNTTDRFITGYSCKPGKMSHAGFHHEFSRLFQGSSSRESVCPGFCSLEFRANRLSPKVFSGRQNLAKKSMKKASKNCNS